MPPHLVCGVWAAILTYRRTLCPALLSPSSAPFEPTPAVSVVIRSYRRTLCAAFLSLSCIWPCWYDWLV